MRVRIQPAATLLALCLIFAIGCGGGGGGGSSSPNVPGLLKGCTSPGGTTTVNYSTEWGSAPSTASQLIEFLGSDGSVVRTDLLNRTAGSTLTLNTVSAAIYSARVKLYSGAGASGSVLALSQQTIDLCAGRANDPTVSLSTSFTSPPTTTYISLSSGASVQGAGFNVLKGLQVKVFPSVFASGKPVFFDPAQLTYQVTGGIGTVDANGVFTATTAGTGTIKAVYPGATTQNAVTVTVTASPAKSKWTVLVYMNAANDLYPYSTLNFNQMETVADKPDQVRFVVQWKQSTSAFPGSSFDGTRRYLVSPDSSSAINSQVLASNMTEPSGAPLDMGLAKNLLEFVQWGRANYPADRYCLVIWNHGNGWRSKKGVLPPARGFSYDDQSRNAIQTWQIQQALGTEHFDLIAWDCSLMQMMEVAYEMRSNADYIIGSEESPPGEGYPYDTIFQTFRDNASGSTLDLAKSFVDKTLAVPGYATRKITQSVVKTDQLPGLASSLGRLGQTLTDNSWSVDDVRANGQGYSVFANYRYFYDIGDMADRIKAGAPVPLYAAATDVKDALSKAVVYEGHNSNSPGSHGLAIDLSPKSFVPSMISTYRLMQFASDTQWDEWLVAQP